MCVCVFVQGSCVSHHHGHTHTHTSCTEDPDKQSARRMKCQKVQNLHFVWGENQVGDPNLEFRAAGINSEILPDRIVSESSVAVSFSTTSTTSMTISGACFVEGGWVAIAQHGAREQSCMEKE